jgi:hypothetical protein
MTQTKEATPVFTTQSGLPDAWKKAFDKQNEQKKAREDSKNFVPFDFEEIAYEGLAIDKPVAFRIIGSPMEYRQFPYEAKLVLQSKMVTDDYKGKTRINWRYVESKGKYIIDPDWILSKLYNNAMSRQFVKYTEKDIDGKSVIKTEDGSIKNSRGYTGEYRDLHTHTKTYQRLKFNKTINEQKSFGDAYPSSRIVMNVISRMDDWCSTNKKTKILSTKVGVKEGTKIEKDELGNTYTVTFTMYFPETGISKSAYDELLDYIRTSGVDPTTTDFVITRKYINDKYSQSIIDGEGLLKLGRASSDILNKIKSGKLTEEESKYETYDLDKFFAVSSYNKIKKKLSGLFKLYDEEFHDNLYDELCALALEEEKLREEKAIQNPEDFRDEEYQSSEKEIPAEKKEERKVRTVDKAIDFSIVFPFWSSLLEEDKNEMKTLLQSANNVDSMIFKPNTPLLPCTACGRNLPNTVFHCPCCGTEL